MVTPVNIARNTTSGTSLYAGRTATPNFPAWRVGAPLNAWIAIPGTAGCGGASVDPWGGFPIRDDGDGLVQIAFLAAGGHANSSDNRVVSCDLSVDSPSWTTRVTTSLTPYNSQGANAAETVNGYYSWDTVKGDNPKPGSSHLYDYVYWSKFAQKYLRVSATGVYSDGGTSACVDSISPLGTTWQWDPPGTNPQFPYQGNGASQARGNPNDGYIWAANRKWRPGDATWGNQSHYTGLRFPYSYDPGRDCIFNLQYDDGIQRGLSGNALQAKQTFLTAASNRSISFNAGAALTKFLADKPDYAGMDYDTTNGYFLFMYDRNDGLNLQGLMKVTPNTSAVWDLDIFTPAGGGVTPDRTPTDGSGINGRLKYSPTLKGFVYIPRGSSGAYFMRTT